MGVQRAQSSPQVEVKELWIQGGHRTREQSFRKRGRGGKGSGKGVKGGWGRVREQEHHDCGEKHALPNNSCLWGSYQESKESQGRSRGNKSNNRRGSYRVESSSSFLGLKGKDLLIPDTWLTSWKGHCFSHGIELPSTDSVLAYLSKIKGNP